MKVVLDVSIPKDSETLESLKDEYGGGDAESVTYAIIQTVCLARLLELGYTRARFAKDPWQAILEDNIRAIAPPMVEEILERFDLDTPEGVADLRHEAALYVLFGDGVGDFLRELFSNKLEETISHGDGWHEKHLEQYTEALKQAYPPSSHGSDAAYDEWMSSGGLFGQVDDGALGVLRWALRKHSEVWPRSDGGENGS